MFLTRWQKVRRKVDTFTGTATRRLLRGPPRTFLRVSRWKPACGFPDRGWQDGRRAPRHPTLPEAVMSQLLVLSFDTEEAATKALQSLRSLEHEGKANFEDTAVVTRDADGDAHVKNEASAATE